MKIIKNSYYSIIIIFHIIAYICNYLYVNLYPKLSDDIAILSYKE